MRDPESQIAQQEVSISEYAANLEGSHLQRGFEDGFRAVWRLGNQRKRGGTDGQIELGKEKGFLRGAASTVRKDPWLKLIGLRQLQLRPCNYTSQVHPNILRRYIH